MKKTVGVAIAVGASFVLCGPVFAGETTGNGEDTPGGGKAHSACNFSGQDLPDAEEDQPPQLNDDFVSSPSEHAKTMVQSYGMYVRADLKGVVPSPGEACNGSGGGEG
jgi:hypothetical protein